MLITCECQHLKQEIKCNASKSSEGNSKKTLSCDDECARLARNQRLALALNIDPEAHKDDHIPYSNETLKMFRENVKWAQIQEREFRVFAADEAEKRLRFKPMPPHQRAFLHSLSEDFGFDSESVDPEPHRHIAVFKTPRFVVAPMKTLSECVRIRAATAEAAIPQSIASDTEQRKLQFNNAPLNGFVLSHPRFGLTIEDLRSDLSPALDTAHNLAFDISFLPSEEIVLKTRPSTSSTMTSTDSAIATSLRGLKPAITSIVASKRLAQATHLCALDPSLNILRREIETGPDSAGWSQVAAKAAAPRMAPRQMAVGERSVFTVLGSKLRDAKKKKKQEEEEEERRKNVVVDDWEEEVRKEEEEEDDNVGETKGAASDGKGEEGQGAEQTDGRD